MAQMAHSTLLGAGGTPTFFINGRILIGAQPVAKFAAIIDEELTKADDRIAKGTKAADYYKTWVITPGWTSAPWNTPTAPPTP